LSFVFSLETVASGISQIVAFFHNPYFSLPEEGVHPRLFIMPLSFFQFLLADATVLSFFFPVKSSNGPDQFYTPFGLLFFVWEIF